MGIVTTTSEALALSSQQAEEVLEKLEEIIADKLENFEPPDDFDDRMAVWMLAGIIDNFNRMSLRSDSPFGSGGWLSLIPEDELGENGYSDLGIDRHRYLSVLRSRTHRPF